MRQKFISIIIIIIINSCNGKITLKFIVWFILSPWKPNVKQWNRFGFSLPPSLLLWKGILRVARCHILGLLYLITPHSVTPVCIPACFNVSCHFHNKRKCRDVSKTRFHIKVFLEMLLIALRLSYYIWPSTKASPLNSIPLSSMKIFKILGNFFILLELSSLLLFLLWYPGLIFWE